MLNANSLINGRYRILRTVGVGGMGSVYAAQDERLGRQVALKLLRADLATDTRARERFLREAQIAAQLRHPHIVRTYDVGESPEGPYLVQELLDGDTLDAILPLPPAQAADTIDQTADALSYIHGLGYIHCDIKPHNIMLLNDPVTGTTRVVLLDFGIARVAGTDTTTLIATPHYLAPERMLGEPPSIATDLYALGIVFYQTLTGHPPFDGANLHAIIDQHRTAPLPPLNLPQPEAVALEPLIGKLAAKQPDARYPSAEAFRADLAAVRSGSLHDRATVMVSPAAVTARPAAAPVAIKPPLPAVATLAPVAHKQIGMRFLWLPLLLGVLLLGAFAVRNGRANDATPASIAPPASVASSAPSAPATLPASEAPTAPAVPVQTVSVPPVIGLPVEQAQQQIEAVGLDFVVGERVPNEQPADTVVSTTPGTDQPVAPGAQVVVQLSAGQPQIAPPPPPANENQGKNEDKGKNNKEKDNKEKDDDKEEEDDD